MHFLAQSGFVAVNVPEAARARAHCESENQPVQVTVLRSAPALVGSVNADMQMPIEYNKVRIDVCSSPILTMGTRSG